MPATTYAEASEDLVLVVARIFDAPRELVFKMFTDPEHLAGFWGPKGFEPPWPCLGRERIL
jgi:uncharacterized protein YndB with AHSA1/START domain